MGRWIKKFSERPPVSTDSADALHTMSALSIPYRAHCENLHAVRPEQAATIDDPVGPCPNCGSDRWWQLQGEPWHCRACEPMNDDAACRATTLTLPCHKGRDQPTRDPARVKRMVEDVCRGLSITPEQLWRELEEGAHLSDLASGALNKNGLRLTAETLALMHYST
jgi:hypothetical protein